MTIRVIWADGPHRMAVVHAIIRPLATSAIVFVALSAATLAGCSSQSDGDTAGDAASSPSPTTTATAPTTVAAARSVDEAQLQAFADGLLPETGAEGGIVAWAVGDDEPLVVATGVADARTGQEMRADDAFHVASITKSYVAAALVLLAADGELDLDDPLSDHVDWPGGDAISVRQLLDHSSGVPAFGNSSDEDNPYLDLVASGPVTLDQVLDATRDLPRADEPGRSTTYSNLNYVLAGAVIESVTGDDVGSVLARRLFEPLGMDDTWYAIQSATDTEPLPGLFEIEADQPPLPTTEFSMEPWRTVTAPASGAVSTVEDLFAWRDAVLRDRAISGTDVSAMTEITRGGYGLGVVGVTDTGACIFNGGCTDGDVFSRWGLNGDIPGSSTRLLHDPTTDSTLFVYLNRNALALDGPMLAFVDG